MACRDLVEEAARLETQPDDVDAQHPIAREYEGVQPQVVKHDVDPLAVLGAVDLDDEAAAVPPHVQVDATPGPASDDLARGLWQSASAAERREVQLSERLHAEGDVADDRPDERAAGPAARSLGPRPGGAGSSAAAGRS
jgi:hypothetical protein